MSSQERGLPFVVGTAIALLFGPASQDVMRAKAVIEHLTDAMFMLGEMHCVLRPGGHYMCHVPSQFSTFYPVANFWDDYTHVRPLSRVGLRRLLEDGGFDIVFIKGYTSGRNLAERLLSRLLGVVFLQMWRALARKPLS